MAAQCVQNVCRITDTHYVLHREATAFTLDSKMLRALALVTVLGLHSTAGAVEAAFHLCNGAAQFELTCCCSAEETADAASESVAEPQGQCCSEISAQHQQPTPATSVSAEIWSPPPFELQPSVAALAAPTGPLAVDWGRTRGVHRATAPPLFVQNCSYLI